MLAKHLLVLSVLSELCRINEHQKVALDLDPYVKKLLNARRRVVLVNNILQNAQVSPSCGPFNLHHQYFKTVTMYCINCIIHAGLIYLAMICGLFK